MDKNEFYATYQGRLPHSFSSMQRIPTRKPEGHRVGQIARAPLIAGHDTRCGIPVCSRSFTSSAAPRSSSAQCFCCPKLLTGTRLLNLKIALARQLLRNSVVPLDWQRRLRGRKKRRQHLIGRF